MKLRAQPFVLLIIFGVLCIASIGALVAYQLPALRNERTKLDAARTNILALEEQEANLEFVRKQLSEVTDRQAVLDSYVWSFEQEEAFFSQVESLARNQAFEAEGLTLADAVPTGNLVLRTGSVTLTGSPNAVFSAIVNIQKIKPVVGISNSKVVSAADKNVSATLDFSTVWR